MPEPTLEDKIAALKPKATDDFSRSALDGARHALADGDNPLRLNFFSTAMRILFEHMMDTLSPNDEVIRCSWFEAEREEGKPTRWQRIIFAIQGGLSEAFVTQELKVDPLPLRKRLLGAIDELSKHVHGRENTLIRDRDEQDQWRKRRLRPSQPSYAVSECRFRRSLSPLRRLSMRRRCCTAERNTWRNR